MAWLAVVTWGMLAGFTMSLMLGTVFFALLQTSIHQGYRYGMAIAAGVVLSDICFLVLALGFDSTVSRIYGEYKGLVALIGASALVTLGLVQFFRRPPHAERGRRRHLNAWQCAGKGFMLNIVNPGNLLLWLIALNTPVTIGLSFGSKVLFSSSGLVAIFLTESLISWGAQKLRRWATPVRLHRLDQVVGSIFVLAGLQMLWKYWM
jgi:threonine/homoserine/homoserine lactone efflux protein